MITFAICVKLSKKHAMLLDKLKTYDVVLASKSPRRQELLKGLGVDFRVCVSDEPEQLRPEWKPEETVVRLARQKAGAVFRRLSAQACPKDASPLMVIGGDTIVVVDGKVLGKPKDEADAHRMLRLLSGKTHTVFSGVCILTTDQCLADFARSEVTFCQLPEADVDYYIRNCRPMDKAGAYGVQEWIGYRAISEIQGSFYNVMGFPTHLFWRMLESLF